MKASLWIFHATAKEGKYPHLLFGPNFEEPSARKVAVNEYLSNKE
jgi:hypothetical protein